MHFEASADIRAPADRIWSILTDAPGYPTWDSGVTRVEGTIADGETITVHSEVAAGRAFPVKVAMRPPNEMTWTGGMPLGLFTGVRTFRLFPTTAARESRCARSTPARWSVSWDARSPTSSHPSSGS